MSESDKRTVQIPEICRVEGHSAVTVEIKENKVVDVKLDVFEGTRFFERIIVGHKYDEVAHISSRVCAICSTGHLLAALRAIENAVGFKASAKDEMCRELMHLGMIIESHATHICALALPDFLKIPDLHEFAGKHPQEFGLWIKLRKLGAAIQTVLGGRPFHAVNLHAGGLSRYPGRDDLQPLKKELEQNSSEAESLCNLLLSFKLPVERTAPPSFLALIPDSELYGYFGDRVRSSDGWEAPVSEYKTYLDEQVVSYSHAKRSLVHGKTVMVGSLARLFLFSERLGARARSIYEQSPLSAGSSNTILNNLAQGIEIVEAIERAIVLIDELSKDSSPAKMTDLKDRIKASRGTGAVECPRGTLYHHYEMDDEGKITAADMITPSAQNTARIEHDISCVVEHHLEKKSEILQEHLETLVRAYDPCNTCATHMVEIRYLS